MQRKVHHSTAWRTSRSRCGPLPRTPCLPAALLADAICDHSRAATRPPGAHSARAPSLCAARRIELRNHETARSPRPDRRRSWRELCDHPCAHWPLWGLAPPSCHSTGERQRPRGATGSQGTGRACSAVALPCFAFSQATFHKGTREILLNPAFSVQNSLVRASSSLLLYLAQVNPAGTESPDSLPQS